MDTSTTPTPSSSLFPSWRMITVSENAIKISIAFELVFSAGLADVQLQGCRKCVGFSLVAGSGGDSHPPGFSSLWFSSPGFSLLLSQPVCGHHWWKGLGLSKGSVHIPRVCPSPIPRLVPCLAMHIQRFTPGCVIGYRSRFCRLLDLCDGSQGYSQNPLQSVA